VGRVEVETMAKRSTIDVRVDNLGTMFAFVPQSRTARTWFARNVHSDPWQWMGGTLMVEHRYAVDICDALLSEGFQVQNA
jgi:hypothetical protein